MLLVEEEGGRRAIGGEDYWYYLMRGYRGGGETTSSENQKSQRELGARQSNCNQLRVVFCITMPAALSAVSHALITQCRPEGTRASL